MLHILVDLLKYSPMSIFLKITYQPMILNAQLYHPSLICSIKTCIKVLLKTADKFPSLKTLNYNESKSIAEEVLGEPHILHSSTLERELQILSCLRPQEWPENVAANSATVSTAQGSGTINIWTLSCNSPAPLRAHWINIWLHTSALPATQANRVINGT